VIIRSLLSIPRLSPINWVYSGNSHRPDPLSEIPEVFPQDNSICVNKSQDRWWINKIAFGVPTAWWTSPCPLGEGEGPSISGACRLQRNATQTAAPRSWQPGGHLYEQPWLGCIVRGKDVFKGVSGANRMFKSDECEQRSSLPMSLLASALFNKGGM